MEEFVENWDDHRGTLLEGVKTVDALVTATIDGFSGADAQLAEELRKARKKK